MKKLLKWIGIILGGLIGLLILALAVVYLISSLRMNKSYAVQAESIAIPDDSAAAERGQHVAVTRGCLDCHGENLAGGTIIEDPLLGGIHAANLTPGSGGVGQTYSDADWIRAIRHGLDPDSKPLIFMPSHEFYYLSDDDLGVLIAYLKTLPPVDNQPAETSIGPLGRTLYLAGQIPLVPAELIDHDAPRPSAPPPGLTIEYGQYLAVGCAGCHGQTYAGGPIPGGPPDWPPAANLTPAGNPGNWTEADFINTLRTGVTPEGNELNPEYMPWPTFGKMTDDELKAIWLYLQSLPAQSLEDIG